MIEYRPHFIPSAVYVVGCGGTGSRLVPILSQLVRTTMRSHNPLGWIESLPIFLIDNDVVENKNLLRQNFIPQDVGQHKSVVLANRYSKAFDIPIYPSTQRVEKTGTALRFIGTSDNLILPTANIILIMAVDSAEARRDVLSHFNRMFSTKFVIDAGNEDSFGQVRFFTETLLISDNRHGKEFVKNLPKMVPAPYTANYIPYPGDYYSKLGSSASEKSCADLDQTLAINGMMAMLMGCILQNFLYMKKMSYHAVSFNLNGSVTTTYNTPENWFQYVTSEYPPPQGVRYFNNCNFRESDESDAFGRYYRHLATEFGKMNLRMGENGELLPMTPPIPAEKIATKPSASKRAKKVTTVTIDDDIDLDAL